jgi:hypothetical protein
VTIVGTILPTVLCKEKADAWAESFISLEISKVFEWSGRRDSNPRPSAPKADQTDY